MKSKTKTIFLSTGRAVIAASSLLVIFALVFGAGIWSLEDSVEHLTVTKSEKSNNQTRNTKTTIRSVENDPGWYSNLYPVGDFDPKNIGEEFRSNPTYDGPSPIAFPFFPNEETLWDGGEIEYRKEESQIKGNWTPVVITKADGVRHRNSPEYLRVYQPPNYRCWYKKKTLVSRYTDSIKNSDDGQIYSGWVFHTLYSQPLYAGLEEVAGPAYFLPDPQFGVRQPEQQAFLKFRRRGN
ncbi:MAG: hypothetical protein MPJ24_08615 [Pirellulaceae bacterium]|nr:hypothetical protein [Pirellulaceae bacterium]